MSLGAAGMEYFPRMFLAVTARMQFAFVEVEACVSFTLLRFSRLLVLALVQRSRSAALRKISLANNYMDL